MEPRIQDHFHLLTRSRRSRGVSLSSAFATHRKVLILLAVAACIPRIRGFSTHPHNLQRHTLEWSARTSIARNGRQRLPSPSSSSLHLGLPPELASFGSPEWFAHHGPPSPEVVATDLSNVFSSTMHLANELVEEVSEAVTSAMHTKLANEIVGEVSQASEAVSHVMHTSGIEDVVSEEAFLESLGHDVLVFLATTVVVVPLSTFFGITPVLGFLAAGFLLGPYGLQIFGNTEADLQLGDFGILFLLFLEGLNLSPDRLKKLGAFGWLGVVQLLASMGLLFFGLVAAGPLVVQYAAPVLRMDDSLFSVFSSPVEAFCIAAAGALSSSAFVLPVLKEKGWAERSEGIAALSVLLLQDLAVAPLLVILPLVAGEGPQTSAEFAILIAKATIGFGAVLYAGSWLLKKIFDIVAAARSTETFVAAALFVALSMGEVADALGLSATTGAFAAGVLLANNKYRAQIKADIQPFEGLFLGIFFVTAGASLDPQVILSDFPTLMLGIAVFIVAKAIVLYLAGQPLGKTKAESARVAITLAGGGEFSLVLLNLARDLNVLPIQLSKLLAASVVISMSLTPLLGSLAAVAGDFLESRDDNLSDEARSRELKQDLSTELFDTIDLDGSGTIEYEELRTALLERGLSPFSVAEIFELFDTDSNGSISRDEWEIGMSKGYLSSAISHEPGTLVEMKEMNIKVARDAIVICGYTEFGREMYQILEAAGCANNGGLVAFDLNPSRVAAGLLAGETVVYGNAASPELLRAAGVVNPRGVVVAFRSEGQRLEATARLRERLPEGTPIYSRVISGQSVSRENLLSAGATDVVSERSESALRFAVLLGAVDESQESNLNTFRQVLTTRKELSSSGSEVVKDPIPGITQCRLEDLAEEFGCTTDDLLRLWNIFSSLPDAAGDQYLPVDELEEVFLRRSGKPIDDEMADAWKEFAGDASDGCGRLGFADFARVYYKAGMNVEKT